MFAIKTTQFTRRYQFPRIFFRRTAALLILLLSAIANNVYAVFIDFDDIEARPSDPFGECSCGHILSDEYASQGLLFEGDGSWLIGSSFPDGTNQNGVQAYNGISISFLGRLPNFISFNGFSVHQDAIFTEVWGENGYLFTHVGSGWRGTEETSTPYIPGELISFSASEGIKSLYISSLYNLRVGPYIDNLTFEYKSVPESSALVIFIIALTSLFWRRAKQQ